MTDGEHSSAWHETALEQFCRELPLKAKRLKALPPDERIRLAAEYVTTLRRLLTTIVTA